MTKKLFASVLLLAGLTSVGCDKTGTNFENVPYEFFDLGTGDGGSSLIPGKPLADAVQYDRVGRVLVSTMMVNPFGLFKDTAYTDEYKDRYNGAVPLNGWLPFSAQPYIQASLGIWDSLDVNCGNQIGANTQVSATRYHKLGDLLADDRLWVDTTKTSCKVYMGVEQKFINPATPDDCGGRPLVEIPSSGVAKPFDAVDQTYNLLIGSGATVTDGVASDSDGNPGGLFPFLVDAK